MKRHDCSREGCPGTYSHKMHKDGYRHCSTTCAWIDRDLNVAIDSIRDADDPRVEAAFTDAYLALVQAADALSEYRRHRNRAVVAAAQSSA
jgi:hypothetical protein